MNEPQEEELPEVEEVVAEVVASPATPAFQPPKIPGKQEKPKGVGRPPGKAGQVPETTFKNTEAELLWPEMLEYLHKVSRTPYDIVIRVIRLEPPPRQQIGYPLEAASVQGDETQSPGDALVAAVTDVYHLPIQNGPARYELMWVLKSSGTFFGRGELRLPSRTEIQYQRAAAEQWRLRSGLGGGPVIPGPGFAMPHGQAMPQMPPMPMYYPMMPTGPARESEEVRQLREEVRALRERLAPPTPSAATPTVSPLEEVVERVTTRVLGALGVKPGVGLGAPQAAASNTESAVAGFRGLVTAVRELRALGRDLDGVFETEEAAPAAGEPRTLSKGGGDDDFEVPFVTKEIGKKWDDGSEVGVAISKRTGNIDYPASLTFANPRLTQKFTDKIIDKIANSLSNVMDNIAPKKSVGAGAPPSHQLPLTSPTPGEHAPVAAQPDGAQSPRGPGWDLS